MRLVLLQTVIVATLASGGVVLAAAAPRPPAPAATEGRAPLTQPTGAWAASPASPGAQAAVGSNRRPRT